LLDLARASECPCVVVDCDAPVAELRRRIVERENDPSEANLQVLERQLQRRQPVDETEAGVSGIVRLGAGGLGDADAARIGALLVSKPSADPR
jgi:predicted kinase